VTTTGGRQGPRRGRQRRARAARLVAATVAAAALLAACGQRGPLYLPDSRPAKKLAPAAPGEAARTGTRIDAPAAVAIPDA